LFRKEKSWKNLTLANLAKKANKNFEVEKKANKKT
jgi:hypothetical protein